MRLSPLLLATAAATLFAPLAMFAQIIPDQALHAKSAVVLNDTHSFAVQRGAEAELKHSGRLKVVADLDVADLVLSFTRKPSDTPGTAPGTAAATPGAASSAPGTAPDERTIIVMAASTRDRVAPFFRTETDQSGERAGQACVDAFLLAWSKASGGRH